MVRKEKDDFLAVHEFAAANCLIRDLTAGFIPANQVVDYIFTRNKGGKAIFINCDTS